MTLISHQIRSVLPADSSPIVSSRIDSSPTDSRQYRRVDSRPAAFTPAAFTLVELLVVMVIIGILVALLVPVIGIARASVQEATMTTEVAGLGQSLRSFRTQFQSEYPPDFSDFSTPKQQQINRFMMRLFRNRNPLTDVPRNASGPRPELLENLDPSEALYFWLRGFSSDPSNPLFGRLNETAEMVDQDRTPLFEFDRLRLNDADNDGFLEYYPEHASNLPFVYYANYSYVQAFQAPLEAIICRNGVLANAAFPAPRPYLSTVSQPVPASGSNEILVKDNFAASDSFQILCAGLDNEFGTPVNFRHPQYPAYAYPEGPFPEKTHLDNITNFAEGTLEDALP